ncbi:MAG: hypothetical protein LWW93_15925 [Hyphomicrobiales bacterium]|nr:hypothetical protein [Hyphomicrobiales bacterium]
MKTPRGPSSNRLRPSRPTTWLALALLFFQVVLTADHLGAVTARVTSILPIDAAGGLLALCHGDETSTAKTDGSGEGTTSPPCVLCSAAALAAVGMAATPPVVVAPADLPVAILVFERHELAVFPRPPRWGTVRGPPSSLLV